MYRPQMNPDLRPLAPAGGEDWVAGCRRQVDDVPAVMATAKELLSWLEDAEDLLSAQEALDVMEILGDVLAVTPSADDFLTRAFAVASGGMEGGVSARVPETP